MKRTALITGGSSGIGRAMVREFVDAGYAAMFTYHTGAGRAEGLIEELGSNDVQAFHLALGDRESHRALMKALPGPIDVLVNNAGLGSRTVENVSMDVHEQDEALLNVNSLSPLRNVVLLFWPPFLAATRGVVTNSKPH